MLIGNKVSGAHRNSTDGVSEDPVHRNSGSGVFEVLMCSDIPQCLIGNKVSGAPDAQKLH